MIYLTIYLYLMAGFGFGFAGHMILKEIKGRAYSEDLFIILFCWTVFTLVWLPMLIALLVMHIFEEEQARKNPDQKKSRIWMRMHEPKNTDQGGPL